MIARSPEITDAIPVQAHELEELGEVRGAVYFRHRTRGILRQSRTIRDDDPAGLNGVYLEEFDESGARRYVIFTRISEAEFASLSAKPKERTHKPVRAADASRGLNLFRKRADVMLPAPGGPASLPVGALVLGRGANSDRHSAAFVAGREAATTAEAKVDRIARKGYRVTDEAGRPVVWSERAVSDEDLRAIDLEYPTFRHLIVGGPPAGCDRDGCEDVAVMVAMPGRVLYCERHATEPPA